MFHEMEKMYFTVLHKPDLMNTWWFAEFTLTVTLYNLFFHLVVTRPPSYLLQISVQGSCFITYVVTFRLFLFVFSICKYSSYIVTQQLVCIFIEAFCYLHRWAADRLRGTAADRKHRVTWQTNGSEQVRPCREDGWTGEMTGKSHNWSCSCGVWHYSRTQRPGSGGQTGRTTEHRVSFVPQSFHKHSTADWQTPPKAGVSNMWWPVPESADWMLLRSVINQWGQ